MTEKQIKAGFTGFKSPNLTECMRHYFQEDLPGAHDALVDARASGRIYWHLKGLT
jgi:DNA polymerase-3 subunit epsilon